MNRSAFKRIVKLQSMIASGQMRSAREAAKKLKTSQRSIERDLNLMRTCFGRNFSYNQTQGAYEPAKGFGGLSTATLTAEEIALVLTAERALRLHKGFTLQPVKSREPDDGIHAAFNKLVGSVQEDAELMDEVRSLCRSIVFHRPFTPERDVSHAFYKVFTAIRTGKRLSIAYQDTKGRVTHRHMDPWFLINNGGDWSVLGYCHSAHDKRTFRLDRIYNPRITEHNFVVPSNFKISEFLERGFGRMQGGDSVQILLKIWGSMVGWAKGIIWHPSQRIEEKRDKSIVLCLKCPVTDTLVNWVLQMAGNVRVISPKELREKVVERAGMMIEENTGR